MSAGFDVVDALAGLSEDLRSEGEFVSRIHDAVEKLKQERDEARAYAEERNDEANKLQRLLNMAATERDEARAEAAMLEDRLSESRAEVERLTDERDELPVRVANQEAELRATREAYNEARAKVDRLKLSARLWADDIDAVSNAFRRGAEAMREACARVANAHCVPGTRDVIRALPIPEEP